MALSRTRSDGIGVTPERWQQIRSVFEHAELLNEEERERYLDQACAGDAELRAEVESLLNAMARAGSVFMAQPAADLVQTIASEEPIASRIGRRVGPYEIVAEIGHGGMGEVYRAVRIDGQFDQEAAIKLVRVGMGSSFIVERFLHERQILASLNHPNIARLLDGGTTDDGVPYLVMELIEGERIDTYCQAQRLSVTERLRLFLEVCGAVQYAHQRLVIHRDIKPSNILVTREGVPKLLDFGIAKIVDPSGDAETTMARPMTPEYASPEQIRGEAITTATDVYSLGVVLYQLVTGRSPYRISAKTPLGLSRAIAETDAQRPSTIVMSPVRADENGSASAIRSEELMSAREPTPARLRRRLSGDVDSILLMALRKEPERRYRSVEQFADDITRHLNGVPVTASKGSWNYTAGKFIARHRVGVAATVLVILALVGGILTTERQARIARSERAKAQKRFDDVRQFSNALIFDIHDALQDIPGTTPARNLLLDRAVQYLDRVAKDADGDSQLQRELAFAYQRLATVQGDSTVSNMGQVSASELSAKKATALFEAVANANPTNTTDQLNVAMIYRKQALSDVYYPQGRPEIDKALAITDRLMQSDGHNPKVLIERAIELQVLASSLEIAGDRNQSVAMFRRTRELLQNAAQRDPSNSSMPARMAKTTVQLGFELAHTNALDEAQRLLEEGIAAYEMALKNTSRPDMIRDLAQSRIRLGFVLAMRGNFVAAKAECDQAIAAIVPLAKSDPHNIFFREDVLTVEFEQARLLVVEGRFREGRDQLHRVITEFESLDSEEDAGPGMGTLYSWLGEAQMGNKEYAPALQSFQKALQILEKDVPYDDGRCGIVIDYARAGDVLLQLKRPAEAEEAYKKALAKSDLSFALAHNDVPALQSIAGAYAGFGGLRMAMAAQARDPEEASRLRDDACGAWRQSSEIETHLTNAVRFSSSNFPMPNRNAAWNCPGIAVQFQPRSPKLSIVETEAYADPRRRRHAENSRPYLGTGAR
jgi:eukaryotic-like serine/threonine-protein kinase